MTSRTRGANERTFSPWPPGKIAPWPETHLWEQFDDQQKLVVVETLARLLVKATQDKHQEQTND